MNGSAGTCPLRCFQILIGSVDLDALKTPAPKGGVNTVPILHASRLFATVGWVYDQCRF